MAEPEKDIYINLLKRDTSRLIKNSIIISAILIFLIPAGLIGMQYRLALDQLAREQNINTGIKAEIEAKQISWELLKANQELKNHIQKKNQAVEEAEKSRVSYIRVLDTIEQAVPGTTILLEKIEIKDRDLIMNGCFYEPTDFTQFLLALNQNPLIKNIKVLSSNIEENKGIFTLHMEWEAEIK